MDIDVDVTALGLRRDAPVRLAFSRSPEDQPSVGVSTNVPGLRASPVGPNSILLAGRVTHDGIVASRFSLDLDGERISVELEDGMRPRQVAAAIAETLPPEYRATTETQQIPLGTRPGYAPVKVTIHRSSSERPVQGTNSGGSWL